MAVTRVATPHEYVGLAADPKPTVDVPAGSHFIEQFVCGQIIFPTSVV